uniref:30S ribosomal protein S17 n=1 Tax=candidate division WWE3 bacterium TaxID=2053526 RepID=A0A831Z068_UNCKA
MTRKKLKGTIKKLSSAKTAAVEVARVYHHPLYRKRIRASKTYLAHFEGEVEVGQPVVIEEGRPISKRKRWRVVEVGGRPVGPQARNMKEKVKVEEPRAKRRKAKRNGKK